MKQAFLDLGKRFEELGRLLASPEVLANRPEYARLAREHARLAEAAAAVQRLRALEDQTPNWRISPGKNSPICAPRPPASSSDSWNTFFPATRTRART